VQLAFSLQAVICQQLVPRADGTGRILAAEVLIKNHAVANHIRTTRAPEPSRMTPVSSSP